MERVGRGGSQLFTIGAGGTGAVSNNLIRGEKKGNSPRFVQGFFMLNK